MNLIVKYEATYIPVYKSYIQDYEIRDMIIIKVFYTWCRHILHISLTKLSKHEGNLTKSIAQVIYFNRTINTRNDITSFRHILLSSVSMKIKVYLKKYSHLAPI